MDGLPCASGPVRNEAKRLSAILYKKLLMGNTFRKTRCTNIGSGPVRSKECAMGTLSSADLTSVLAFISNAVLILGGVLLAWGLVSFGLAVKDGQGMNSDNAWGKIIGGAVIIGAAAVFKTIA